MKKFYDFRVWCENATSGIRYTPDRKMVYGELMNHLYDHYDALVEEGMDEENARTATLEAMGNARQIAPQLAAIHRPFWGYVLSFTRFVLFVTLCAAVACACFWIKHGYDFSQPHYGYTHFNPYELTEFDGMYTHHTRQIYTQPNQFAETDGYICTLSEASVWHVEYTKVENDAHDYDCLYLQIRVFHPLPWAEHRDIGRLFYAVDSLGNTYDCYYDGIQNYAPYITSSEYHTGLLTYTSELRIEDFQFEGVEWIELRYDRSGRNIALRLDLTGGDAA